MTWDKVLWGVELSHCASNERTLMLGSARHRPYRRGHEDEPTRVLLFCTRKQARDWCKSSNELAGHLGWKYTPIKVRERVEKITEESSNG